MKRIMYVSLLLTFFLLTLSSQEKKLAKSGTISIASLSDIIPASTLTIKKTKKADSLSLTFSITKKATFAKECLESMKGGIVLKGEVRSEYVIEDHQIKRDDQGYPIVKVVQTGDKGVTLEKKVGMNDIIILSAEVVVIAPGTKIRIHAGEYIRTEQEGATLKLKKNNMVEVREGVAYMSISTKK